MRLLLDTHAFLWWVFADPKLSHHARAEVGNDDNEILVSAASAWEITTKYRIGKLPEAGNVADNVAGRVASEGFSELTVTMRHAQRAGDLVGHHRDPFDRMLIAQAMLEDLTLVSNERTFDAYGVKRLW
ncbi:MAG: type II toxin-antitoxin system VapC family toxin [Reyranella sp.]